MGRTRRKRRNRTPACHSLDHEPATINLRQFLARNNFTEETKLKLRHFPQTGRGLAATRTLHPNDTIIRIPYRLMITYATLQDLDLARLLTHQLPIHDLLTLFLALERHKQDSFWSSYIHSLPPRPPWLPALLEAGLIESLPVDLRLAASRTRHLMKQSWSRLRRSINGEWRCCCCGARADRVLDSDAFTWGYILVNTRAVYVDPDLVGRGEWVSDEPSMALCPYLDMFNHGLEARTEAGLVSFGGELVYELRTLTKTRKYDQVFISYGAHSNVKLLAEYGFFVPDPSDTIPVPPEIIDSVLKAQLNTDQYTFIKNHHLDRVSELYINNTGPSWALKAYLFTASTEERDLSSTIYADRYSDCFLQHLRIWCGKFLHHQLDHIDHLLTTSALVLDQALVNFLQYRKELIKHLLINDKFIDPQHVQ